MKFSTLGFNYYVGYLLPISVTDEISALEEKEAEGYYKIIYMKSGTCHFLLNGKEFVLTGAYVLCLNERDRILIYEAPEDEVKILTFKPTIINVAFSNEVINNPNSKLSATEYQDIYFLMGFKHNAELNMKILPLRTINSTLVNHKMQQLQEAITSQNTNSWPCRSRSYLFEILFSISRQEEIDEPVSSIQFFDGCSRLAVDVIYYLQSCYNQKITIERLTDEFHTNRTTLLTDFKKHTGQSINGYLIQLRLTMASTLLRDTELSVDEICERTGFSDISYFSKTFKKRLNHTPSEYRRINK